MKLNATNVDEELSRYVSSVNALTLPLFRGDVLRSIHRLKRDPLGTGPYPGVSLFEASNRILSDVVILMGVRRLLMNPTVGSVALPFEEYEVALGVEGGNDLQAYAGRQILIGEAFNVASSFFQTKKASMVKKLQSHVSADYRLLVFNADAVGRPNYYIRKSQPSMMYLPIDMWGDR